MQIRPYREEDLPALTGLMSDLGYPTSAERMKLRMEQMAQMPYQDTFMADIGGEVVGMLGLRRMFYYEGDGMATQVSALVVKQSRQGQGIGKLLLAYAEQYAREHGSSGLSLTSGIRPERERAHAFYKSSGFDATGYRFTKNWQ
ncbi:GNAT family N-acetyltransferase [Paenibacillus kobensis]|uniref:GNAT family N-acetyltransferase n=1 Tax=Paenibacillus kobensis TaxID=59841 RepID=UPI001FEB162D|nr:GNAT family N-acetyltransferase [Paenibacillus kobensis]